MTKVVSNKRQLRRLVELLQRNQEIAKGVCTKVAAQRKWEEFSFELNSLGPPQREWHKWQRVWADLKCKIKKKKTETLTAGGRINRFHQFSDLEEAVIEMLDLDTMMIAPEREAQKSDENEDSLMTCSTDDIKFNPDDFNENMIKTDPSLTLGGPIPVVPPGVPVTEERYHISHEEQTYVPITDGYKKFHEDQTYIQHKFYETMTDLVRDIKRSINNIEDHIKKSVQQQDELLDLKRQKLKLYKEKMKSERVDRKLNLKLKAQLLALKKQKYSQTDHRS